MAQTIRSHDLHPFLRTLLSLKIIHTAAYWYALNLAYRREADPTIPSCFKHPK